MVVAAAVVVVASVVVSAEVITGAAVVVSTRAVVVVSTEETVGVVSTVKVVPVSLSNSDPVAVVAVWVASTEAVEIAVSLSKELVAVSLTDAMTVDEEAIDEGRQGPALAILAASRTTVPVRRLREIITSDEVKPEMSDRR